MSIQLASPSSQVLTEKKISVVVPCYRDEGNIVELFRRLTATLERIAPHYEIIYINDASPDNAAVVLDELAALHPKLTVLHHSRNFGLMAVYDTGYRKATGDAVVVMDGDLQDPPELIEEFIRKWQEGFLVVYGKATSRDESQLRKAGYFLFYRLWQRLVQFHVPVDAGDFSLVDRRVVDVLNAMPEKERFFRGLRAWVGFPQVAVTFKRDARFAGTSTQSFLRYFSWAAFAITSFSFVPLRAIAVLAFVATVLSIGHLAYLFILFLLNVRGPHGFMTLASLILLVSSGIFISLSIIAEYLMRIYAEIKRRPTGIVEREVRQQVVPMQVVGNSNDITP